MKLPDARMAPWAIEPARLLEIQAIYANPFEDVIAKRANLLSQTSGGIYTGLVGRDFKDALVDQITDCVSLAYFPA